MGRQDNAHSYLKQMDKPEEKQFVRQLESFKKRVISLRGHVAAIAPGQKTLNDQDAICLTT